MTRHNLNPELLEKIDTLEQLATSKLEQPDGIDETIGYNFHLSDSYSVQVESKLRTGRAAIYEASQTECDSGATAREMETAVFFSRRDPKNITPRQWGGLAFSALYQHEPQNEIGGFQYDAPASLQRDVYPLSHKQGELYVATLALCRYIDSTNTDSNKYAKRPVFSRPQEEYDDEEFDQLYTWNKAHYYEFDDATNQHPTVGALLVAANTLLADGAILRRNRLGPLGETENVYIESNTISGSLEHVDFRLAGDPKLQVSVTIGDIEYEYERTRQGNVEIKFHGSNPVERYKGLKSFKWLDDEEDYEGEEINDEDRCFTYDESELKAIEAEERAMGLYAPSSENLDHIIANLRAMPTQSK